jgi:DNA helicase IV
MSRHEDFERKINRSLNTMEAKISYLHEGMRGLQDSFKEFHEDITEYMAFSAEKYADPEKRLSALERKVK